MKTHSPFRARAGQRRPRVIVRLGGGLGNQLFQYAFGRRMAVVNGADLRVDATGYERIDLPDPGRGIRMLGLPHFGIIGQIILRQETPVTATGWTARKFRKYQAKLLDWLEASKPYYLRRTVYEPEQNHFRFDERLCRRRIRGSVAFHGYWQTEKYFVDIERLIRQELVVRHPLEGPNAEIAQRILGTNSVSIHVRHGDNTTVAAALGVLSRQYYVEAISSLCATVSDPHFFVFSDDTAWAREMLAMKHPTTYVNHNGDLRNHEDLRLMAFCKHHIVANSTFSWWGAWLGKKDCQIVYAPRRYWQNIDRENPDLYPVQWQLL